MYLVVEPIINGTLAYPAGISYSGKISLGKLDKLEAFSAGGVLSIMNPFASLNSQINGGHNILNTSQPLRKLHYLKLFIEYQYQILLMLISVILLFNSP